jgi:putative SOS response-associated peptidase YedK
MLTVSADDHPLYKRFHRPGEEKRMPVILDPEDFDAWLNCSVDEAMAFMRQYPADRLEAEPFPLPPRSYTPRLKKPKPPPAEPPAETSDLFD